MFVQTIQSFIWVQTLVPLLLAKAGTQRKTIYCALINGSEFPREADLELAPFNIQVDVDWHVIGRLVPAADMSIDTCIDQAIGSLRRQQ